MKGYFPPGTLRPRGRAGVSKSYRSAAPSGADPGPATSSALMRPSRAVTSPDPLPSPLPPSKNPGVRCLEQKTVSLRLYHPGCLGEKDLG